MAGAFDTWLQNLDGPSEQGGATPPTPAPSSPRYKPAPTTPEEADARLADVAAAEEELRQWAEGLRKGGKRTSGRREPPPVDPNSVDISGFQPGTPVGSEASAPARSNEPKAAQPGAFDRWQAALDAEPAPPPPAQKKKGGLAAAAEWAKGKLTEGRSVDMPQPGLPGITPEQAAGMLPADEAAPASRSPQEPDQQSLARPGWQADTSPRDQRARNRFAERDPRRVDTPFVPKQGGSVLDRPEALANEVLLDIAGRNARDQQEGSVSPEAAAKRLADGREAFSRKPPAEAKNLSLNDHITYALRDLSKNPLYRGLVASGAELGKVGTGAVRLAADMAGFDDVEKFARGAEGSAEAVSKGSMQDLKGNDKLAAEIFSSTGNSVPSLAVGMVGGPALRVLFLQSALQEYGSGRDAGFSPAESAARAGIMGAAEAIGERFGLSEQIKLIKSIGKTLPSNELARVFGDMLKKEIPGEQLTTLIQFTADKFGPAALQPNATIDQYLEAAGQTLAVTIGQTMLMGGGPAALGAVRNELRATNQATMNGPVSLAEKAQIPDEAYKVASLRNFFSPAADAELAPTAVREGAVQRFREFAAHFGIGPKAVAKAEEAVGAMPASEAPGYLARFIDRLQSAGLVAKPVDNESLRGLESALAPEGGAGTEDAAATGASDGNQEVRPEGGQGQAQEGLLNEAPAGDKPAGSPAAKSGTYVVSDAISADGPTSETVRLVVRPDGTSAIQRDNGDVIDVTNMVRAGFSAEQAIAQSIGDDTSGKNVRGQQAAASDYTGLDETLDTAAHQAATSPLNDRPEPTDAQKAAGNYAKGHVRISGMDVSIENPKGSIRRSKADSPDKWEVTMPAHYGYIRGTTGADGDHVDLFIGDKGDNGAFWIINQTTPDGAKFDEHKVITGVDSAAEAIELYKRSFTDDFGSKVLGSVSQRMDAAQIKALLPDMSKANALHTPKAFNDLQQPDVAVPTAAAQAMPDAGGDQPGRGGGNVGPAADGQSQPGGPAAAPGGGGQQDVAAAGPAPGADQALTDLAALKRQWQEAVARGDTETAKRINDQIVAAKAAAKSPAEPVAESQAPAPSEPGDGGVATTQAGGAAASRIIGKYGRTPKVAVPIELRKNDDGTLTPFSGKYAMVDYESGEPIVLPADVTDAQAAKAIRDAGAVSTKDNFYGVKPDQEASADAQAPVVPQQAAQPDNAKVVTELRARADALKALIACLQA